MAKSSRHLRLVPGCTILVLRGSRRGLEAKVLQVYGNPYETRHLDIRSNQEGLVTIEQKDVKVIKGAPLRSRKASHAPITDSPLWKEQMAGRPKKKLPKSKWQ